MNMRFKDRVREVNPEYLLFQSLKTVQANLGDLCNQTCSHCHVGASPSGTRVMGMGVMSKITDFLKRHPLQLTLDITGGAPEMNPDFRFLLEATHGLCNRRIVRSNLTVLTEPALNWVAPFLKEHEVTVVASLPCYLSENVDSQRGVSAYSRSIHALRMLNRLGFGDTLELNLVYNPSGTFLPSSQVELETVYKNELFQRHGIIFNRLYTITNAPVGRFRALLEERGAYDKYLALLAHSFNPATAASIMCRSLVSVGWQGELYNCDFNLAMEMPIRDSSGRACTVEDLDVVMAGGEIVVSEHCYCCTAGEGSSCTGSLAA